MSDEFFDSTRAAPINPDWCLVFLVGPSGSGKSMVGRRVAKELGWRIYDIDESILESTGYSSIAEIFAKEGEPSFRQAGARMVESLIHQGKRAIVATGGGTVAIPGVMRRISETSVSIYLKASIDTLWSRLTFDPKELADRPLLAQGDGQMVLQEMLDGRGEFYDSATFSINTDNLEVADTVRSVIAQIHAMGGGGSDSVVE